MKSRYLIIALFAFLASCSENGQDIPNPGNAPDISAVPTTFKQKILIEDYTQLSCGQCPKAHYLIDSLIRLWPDRVFAVNIHVGDILESSAIVNPLTGVNLLDSMFNTNSFYPGGPVNRINTSSIDFAPDYWVTSVQAKIGQVPSCGLAIEASEITALNKLNLTVHTGFSADMFGDYRLHGYVVERNFISNDSIYGQMNDFSFEGLSPDTTLPFYALNDTIRGYNQKYLLKRVITNNGLIGDPIPELIMTRGNSYVKSYVVDLAGINVSNSVIIFFVDKYGTTSDSHWIENVQQVEIGATKDWN
ncbi:MAG: hypothetical protein ACO1G9_11145 [Bacteroidota bacterium]